MERLLRSVCPGDYEGFFRSVEAGCDPTRTDTDGRTLLHWIAESAAKRPCGDRLDNFVRIASDLVRYHGVDVNARDIGGNTALHLAVGPSSPCLLFWLLGRRAELVPNHVGETPQMIARKIVKQDNVVIGSPVAQWRADGGLLILEEFLSYPNPRSWHEPKRFDLHTALMMALLSKLAYRGDGPEARSWSKPSANDSVRALTKRWGFRLVAIVQKESARCLILRKQNERQQACVVAIRGTKTGKDAWADVRAYKRSCEQGRIHSGVNKYVNKICEEIIEILQTEKLDDSVPIYVTGHSLGGAIATVVMSKLATHFVPDRLFMYTFGQPRVGTADFRKSFDSQFAHAYLIQRYMDEVPYFPCNRKLPFFGGYQHCGSLRYLDCNGQLYNDTHYQYEDVRRSAMMSIGENPTLLELRSMWTSAFQQLGHVIHCTEAESPSFDEMESESPPASEQRAQSPIPPQLTSSRSNSSPTVARRSGEQKRSKFLRTTLRGRFRDRGAHSMIHYIKDIIRLSQRVGQPFSWLERPEEAICSQLLNVSLPIDVYDEEIKGELYMKERELAYCDLMKRYTSLPRGYEYSLHPDVPYDQAVSWISSEGLTLNIIREMEELLTARHPHLVFEDHSFDVAGLEGLSPLIEVALRSLLSRILQVEDTEEESSAVLYSKWLCFLLPRSGFTLVPTEEPGVMRLRYQQEKSSYQTGLRTLLDEMEQSAPVGISLSHELVNFEESDAAIARVCQDYHTTYTRRFRERQAAKVLLSNYEYDIQNQLFQLIKVTSGAVRTAATGVAIGGLNVVYRQLASGRHIRTAMRASKDNFWKNFESAGYAKATAIGMEMSARIFSQFDDVFDVIPTLCRDDSNLLGELQILATRRPVQCKMILDWLNGTYLSIGLTRFAELECSSHSQLEMERLLITPIHVFVERVFSLMKYLVVTTHEEVIARHMQRYAKVLIHMIPALENDPLGYREAFLTAGSEMDFGCATEGVDAYLALQSMKRVNPWSKETLSSPSFKMQQSPLTLAHSASEGVIPVRSRKLRTLNAIKRHSPLHRTSKGGE